MIEDKLRGSKRKMKESAAVGGGSHGGLAGTARGGSVKSKSGWKEKRRKILTSLFIRI